MIELRRIRTESHIPAIFLDPKRIKRNEKLVRDFRASQLQLKTSMWSKAKPALSKESGGKCAYCEAPANATAHCDVEHFRPKAHYWWLALCYDNYIFACQVCNQVYKSDHFPVSGARMSCPELPDAETDDNFKTLVAKLTPDPLGLAREHETFASMCRGEGSDLIDPYLEDPGKWFAWEADENLKEVRLIPRQPSDPQCKRVVGAAEQYLGLNREELRQLRFRLYQLIEVTAQIIRADSVSPSIKSTALTALSGAMAGGAMFAGMVRYFVREVWKLPVQVPS
jgi:uncharacterized protein (TIGR02646 family)